MIILGVGCNIGDRLLNLRDALMHIRAINGLTVHQVSPVYESDALLPDNAPQNWDNTYLNVALAISTELNPEQLIAKIKAIEEKMGRLEHLRWSPRVIDIDILAWHEECYHSNALNIPHYELLDRPFALWPLADIAPDWKYCEPNKPETGKTTKELIKKFGSRFNGEAPLHTKQIPHRIDTPMMMGVLNITTDSFSDGGKFIDLEAALAQAENLFNAGADIIDIGAESTRPISATTITPEEEWRRLQPILDTWQSLWLNKNFRPKLSIDTHKPETADKLLSYKIDFFNDVTGLVNPKMLEIVKESNAKIIFMHNLGIPANPEKVFAPDVDVVSAVYQWGEQQLEKLIKLGVDKERLIFDVGIGFGKTAHQSFALIKNISQFHKLGVPLLVGHSRKSFFNQFTNKPFAERDIETAGISEFLATQKVDYLRVHNVDLNMRLLKINAALS
ncbi:MAG: Folate synthesis bifunctional protein [uncultured bacterium]|nr:MAG: Folate synthesis bifunctional protein [uncultured bacterium]